MGISSTSLISLQMVQVFLIPLVCAFLPVPANILIIPIDFMSSPVP